MPEIFCLQLGVTENSFHYIGGVLKENRSKF